MTENTSMEKSIRGKIVDCLIQQVSELELLQSMYPNRNEIIVTDDKILNDIQNFIESKSEYTPNHLDFVVNLSINDLKLEICVNLPSFYPSEEPDIYIRCNQLNRQQETLLNAELSNFIKTNYLGEVCLYTAISWLQDNLDILIFKDKSSQNYVLCKKEEEKNTEINNFTRLWIYSHHIYNKHKREDIVKLAKEFNLTGFSLPGKPGIICIEGASVDCHACWREIKAMSWKKIMIKQTETYELSDQEHQQKFKKFEECHFPNPYPQSNKHNMKKFSKFMAEHGLSQVFNDFFGFMDS